MSEKHELNEQQWRERLTPEQYKVLREKGTERAFTGPYWDNKAHGIYVLADMHQDIFSRHLMTYYTEDPTYGDPANPERPEKGSLDEIILSLFPRTNGGYTDWVRGHGAPRWIVQICLPEKKMDSPYWGIPRMLGGLRTEEGDLDPIAFGAINDLFEALNPGAPLPVWLEELLNKVPEGHFKVDETSDMLPVTPWLLNGGLSLDVDRCFAALFAGDEVFPNLGVDPADGVTKRRDEVENPDSLIDLKTYMQDAYTEAWLQVVRRIPVMFSICIPDFSSGRLA